MTLTGRTKVVTKNVLVLEFDMPIVVRTEKTKLYVDATILVTFTSSDLDDGDRFDPRVVRRYGPSDRGATQQRQSHAPRPAALTRWTSGNRDTAARLAGTQLPIHARHLF